MPPDGTLKEGSKIWHVAHHIDLDAEEIVGVLRDKGIPIDTKNVHTIRSILKRRGLTAPLTTPEGQAQLAHLRPLSASPPTDRGPYKERIKGKLGRPVKQRPEEQRPTAAPNHEGKAAQLRRLIFEMGFDQARAVFAEFDNLHKQMR